MAEIQQPYYAPPQKQRSRWWIPVVVLLSVIGGAFVGVILLGVGFASFIGGFASSFGANDTKVTVKANSILYLNFEGGVKEYTSGSGGLFGGEADGVALMDVLTAIKGAKNDENIKGIYYKPNGVVGFAKQREILAALEDFKASGKFLYAFLPGGAERDYYTAIPSDSIFMPQEAMFEFNGFGGSTAFLKNMFEKLGVEWQVVQREEYKSAGETYNRTGYSAPAREEVRALIDQRYKLFVSDVARLRKLNESAVGAMLQRGIYDPDSLKSLGLIDGFATDLQMKAKLKLKVFGSDTTDKKLNLLGIKDYANHARAENKKEVEKDKEIAIIYGSGVIRSGRSTGIGGQDIASGSFVRELRHAADDESIKAIILRIDSPGGSVQASDEIWHEILRAKAKKPVYASMSDVAASGGYYMAMACDTIIAYPETITGSIGVIAAIPNFAKTCDKIGVTVDTITTGRASLFMDPTIPVSEDDKKHLESLIQSFYERFLERVAQSRHTTPEKIREVAKGRVWTGEAAKANGLVDVTGGLYKAIEIAKKRLGVPENKGVRIHIYPEHEDDVLAIIRMFKKGSDEDDEDDASSQRMQTREDIQTLTKQFVQAQNPAWQETWKAMPQHLREQLAYTLEVMAVSRREQVLATLPWVVEIR